MLDRWLEPSAKPRQDHDRAFRLAFFLHGDRSLALEITTEASARLQVAANSQAKRRYYRRSTKHGSPRRYRVSMGPSQILQRLVYCASEPHERRQEAAGQARDEELVVRFVAFLVRIVIRRNAFHGAVGLARLLHGCSTEETMAIYDRISQDAERFVDPAYLRARKRVLLKEIVQRFGDRLETVRGPHGERSWRSHEPGEGPVARVRRALELCTPWDTPCLPSVGPGDSIDALRFTGDHPDDEHPVEMRRLHALLHPDCFDRLVGSIGLGPPTGALRIPLFSSRLDDDLPTQPPRSQGPPGPPGLSEGEWHAIVADLRRRHEERRRGSIGSLSVRVDGEERARWAPPTAGFFGGFFGDFFGGFFGTDVGTVELDPEAEMVEVFGHMNGAETLLACWLVDDRGPTRPIHLGRGRSIRLRLLDPEAEPRALELRYREGWSPIFASPIHDSLSPGAPPRRRLLPVALLLLLCVAAGMGLLQLRPVDPGPIRGSATETTVILVQGQQLRLEVTEPLRGELVRLLGGTEIDADGVARPVEEAVLVQEGDRLVLRDGEDRIVHRFDPGSSPEALAEAIRQGLGPSADFP